MDRNPKIKENIYIYIYIYIYGTLRYTTLEILKSIMESTKMCAFKADLYSFAMICSKILSGEDPFDGIDTTKELLKKIEKGERPKLPSNCEDLSKLIEKCWTLNPSKRPSFANICKRLTTLKQKYLVEVDVAKTPHFGAFKKEQERSKSKDLHVNDTLVNFIVEIWCDIYVALVCLISRCTHSNMCILMMFCLNMNMWLDYYFRNSDVNYIFC
uniref:Protein kinase domain-containing protein n=1 Tax=Physcomitrium patens TaxID=3218 RepID=A0A7I3Z6Q0_PHYPA